MLQRLAHTLLVITLLLGVGGQWMVLQTAAWAGMFLKYSKEGPISVAISKTFDGHHPCNLCKAVEEGSKESSKPASKTEKQTLKIELFVEVIETLDVWCVQFYELPSDLVVKAVRRNELPGLQPPRAI